MAVVPWNQWFESFSEKFRKGVIFGFFSKIPKIPKNTLFRKIPVLQYRILDSLGAVQIHYYTFFWQSQTPAPPIFSFFFIYFNTDLLLLILGTGNESRGWMPSLAYCTLLEQKCKQPLLLLKNWRYFGVSTSEILPVFEKYLRYVIGQKLAMSQR